MCNRKKECGAVTSIWDYVAARGRLSGNRDILRYLAEQSGISLPDLTPEVLAGLKEMRQRARGSGRC